MIYHCCLKVKIEHRYRSLCLYHVPACFCLGMLYIKNVFLPTVQRKNCKIFPLFSLMSNCITALHNINVNFDKDLLKPSIKLCNLI